MLQRNTTFLIALLAPAPAFASFLSGEALDTAADWLALIVLFIVPEKIAENRHHPQKDAIKTLCLLSLVFGGMLWPIAWLWAYSRPVLFKAAYGVEKHEDYFEEMGEKAKAGLLLPDQIGQLRQELEAMAKKGALPQALVSLRAELDALHARAAASDSSSPAKESA
jgi:hypothetical protein